MLFFGEQKINLFIILFFSKFESLRDEMSAEEILEQAQKAADEAAEKLTLKKPASTVRF